MKDNEIRIKFKPRKIELEPRDLLNLSCLADGEIVEDPLGRHKPGTTFVINHGDIGSQKFPNIMFPAINPIEFYLYSAVRNLDKIKELEIEVAKDSEKINHLLLEQFQFCIFSVAAIEAYLNQIIPTDFEYHQNKKIVFKSELEQKWSIEDKLKKAIPHLVSVSVAGDTILWNRLKSLIALRNDLIHLKTAYPIISDFHSYQDLYRRLLDFDYEMAYKTIQEVIRKIAAESDKLYAKNKENLSKENVKSSWIKVLRKGLRNFTG